MKWVPGKNSSKFLPGKIHIPVFIFFVVFFIACKKEKPPSTPGAITGPKNLCPGETGAIYAIDPVETSTFYVWTVPDDSKIISGQGTTSIVISFGKKSGSICVRANNKSEASEASCMEVTQGGVSNSWCREMDFISGGRMQGVGFSIGDKGYIGTGIDKFAIQHTDFWEFDPEQNLWTQKTNFPGGARVDAIGFAIGNKGYVGTGYISGTNYLKDFWEYDPLLNDWMQKADCGDTARSVAFGFSIGNKGYIGSGSNGIQSARTDFYEYDPSTDQWVKKADVVPRKAGIGFAIGNKGYLGMGNDGSFNHNDFYEYNPNDSSIGFDINHRPLGKWTQKATFPKESRNTTIGFSIGNKGYIGLGTDGDIFFADFFEYNPSSNTWLQKSDFAGGARAYSVGFAIKNNGYVGIGNGGGDPLSNFWVYGQ